MSADEDMKNAESGSGRIEYELIELPTIVDKLIGKEDTWNTLTVKKGDFHNHLKYIYVVIRNNIYNKFIFDVNKACSPCPYGPYTGKNDDKTISFTIGRIIKSIKWLR